MKKLLAVATIAVVGYKVVKKIKERKNEEAEMDYIIDKFEKKYKEYINEVEEEIVVDNDEETIQVEDVEVVEEEKEEIKIFDKIKGIVKAPIKLIVKVCGFICGILTRINRKLENMDRDWCMVHVGDVMDYKYYLKFYLGMVYMILMTAIVICNRYVMLALGLLCKKLNKIV